MRQAPVFPDAVRVDGADIGAGVVALTFGVVRLTAIQSAIGDDELASVRSRDERGPVRPGLALSSCYQAARPEYWLPTRPSIAPIGVIFPVAWSIRYSLSAETPGGGTPSNSAFDST